MKTEELIANTRPIDHRQFLQLMARALAVREYDFMGRALQEWLGVFPGDLQSHLMNACFYYAKGKKANAKKRLLQLVELEPFFLPAYLAYYQFEDRSPLVNGAIAVLGNEITSKEILPVWVPIARTVLNAIGENDLPTLHLSMNGFLHFSGENVLVDLVHLLYAQEYQPDEAVLILARLYHERWPQCLQFKLVLADHAMRVGDEILGLELMQDCAKKDLAGLSAKRLWGENHRYRQLWPAEGEIIHPLVAEIPDHLISQMGWNLLQPGDKQPNFEQNSTVHRDLEDFDSYLAEYGKKEASTCNIINHNDEVFSIFDQVSKSLGKKSIRKVDGRFPVYVVLTSKTELVNKYGTESAGVIFEQLTGLIETIKQKPGWSGMVFTPDDETLMKELGLTVRNMRNPWQIKLSLIDLDHYLAKKGAMIGALVIVGGNDIVPFHQLPNPTDDNDLAVLSDNPYASVDENYFIPEWLIGRMPDDRTKDPGLLLMQVRGAIREHQKLNKTIKSSSGSIAFPLEMLVAFFSALFGGRQTNEKTNSVGYSAAIWRRSSIGAYRPIGSANRIAISPPTTSSKIDRLWLSEVEFAYYNLHGIEDGPEWFGQKDFVDGSDGPDYPIALRPSDIPTTPKHHQVVFSEACYGGYIEGKTIDESIALRFLATGCKGFIGSTCIAYGSIQPPVIGADLLAFLFWKHMQEGYTCGDALLHAKVELAQEMQKRQEFLDGEDQKTLLSFVLYGDPLAQGVMEEPGKAKKIEREQLTDTLMVFSETDIVAHEPVRISEKTIAEVKQILSSYLPGLVDSDYELYQQFIIDTNNAVHKFRLGSPEKLKRHESGNVVLSFQKDVEYQSEQHRYYAKATVDLKGRLIKLAVSR